MWLAKNYEHFSVLSILLIKHFLACLGGHLFVDSGESNLGVWHFSVSRVCRRGL